MSSNSDTRERCNVKAVQVHSADNVVVVLESVREGDCISFGHEKLVARQDVPAGHKVAVRDLTAGHDVIKFGNLIGRSTEIVRRGDHVHTHNLQSLLSGQVEYTYSPKVNENDRPSAPASKSFSGYRRQDGRVATRNEIWVVATVGCVNRTVERIVNEANQRFGEVVDGIFGITHPFGCSQLGDDLANTRKILAGLVNHPNAGGVLVVGLGCESNQIRNLLPLARDRDEDRLRYFSAQSVGDETEQGLTDVEELVEIVRDDRRTPCSLDNLVVGVKCGGSDGFSGLTANPLVGDICDVVSNAGGRAVLTEVPEIFGAEVPLLNRAKDFEVFQKLAKLVNDFKQYFIDHDQPVYENPSPGNREGGITTLEEKSLGAVQKGGSATVSAVLRYGDTASDAGLNVLEAPGNDAVSSTALVAAGATVLLFTTGRGTPLGFPVPTIKIASNTALSNRKPHWIDFDAGAVLASDDRFVVRDALLDRIIEIASGDRAKNEDNGEREIAIWKSGVTL